MQKPELKRDVTISDLTDQKAPPIFYQLQDIRDEINSANIDSVRTYIQKHLIDDINELIKAYNDEIRPLPAGDPVKIEVIDLLKTIGIELPEATKE